MNKPKLIFYDFEIFSKAINPETGECFWMVVLYDYDTKKKAIIINDKEKLKQAYELLKDAIWVGYSSRQYDQFIMKALLLGYNVGYINDKIISGTKGWQLIRDAWKIQFYNFDVQIKMDSLKKIEGFMGSKIKETSVNFELDRWLTPEEIEEVTDYCIHDVQETVKVYEETKEELDSYLAMLEMFNLDFSYLNKTKAQLVAKVLEAEKHPNRGDEFDYKLPDNLILSDKYKHVAEWYLNDENKDYDKKLVTDVAGNKATFAWGGLHSALPKFKHEGIILCMDVASLYPSLIINHDLMSRNVTDRNKYKEIRDKRLELKRLKDARQQPLKIVLNSTYGALKDQYNPLYDPLQSTSVCVYGQLWLLDLIDKIEQTGIGFMCQSNTDGVFWIVNNLEEVEKIKEVCKEWEQRSNLDLEFEIASKLYQKDVNGYLLVFENGKYKSKGGYVGELSKINNDLPIVNRALIDYFIKGTPIEETIMNENRLIEFQKIVKVSNLYKYALHGEERLPEKVLRVFADNRDGAKGVFKLKRKMKDGIEQDVAEKIANTPDKCFIDNDDITEKLVEDYLDKQYYIDLATERLNAFLGIPKKRKTKKKKGEEVEQTEMFLT
jgi:hypothetical protein